MSTRNLAKGFITEYKSSPYEIMECTHIRVTLWNDYPSITSENFQDIFIKITNSPNYKFWDSFRDNFNEDTPFVFKKEDCDDPMIFNIIFYINSDGLASGFTKFNESQDTSNINELQIYTDFKYNSEISDLVVNNSLKIHISENFLENLDILESYDDTKFPTRKLIDSLYIDTFQRYTNLVDKFISDDRYSILTNRLVSTNLGSFRMNINSVYVPYNNVYIGRYKDDLVVCNWNDYMYRITSLTKIIDSEPVVYYSGNIRTSTESYGFGLRDYSIKTMNPYCITCYTTSDPSQEVALVLLDESVVRMKYSYESYIHDPYSIRSGYIVNNTSSYDIPLSDRITDEELLKKVYSVVDKTYSGRLIKVCGSYCIFREDEKYRYIGLEGSLISDNPDLLILNDTCIIDNSKSNSIEFYFMYNNSLLDTINGIDEKYSYLYYSVDNTDIRNSLLSSIRSSPITYNIIPKISESYGGMIFYRNNNYLYRL